MKSWPKSAASRALSSNKPEAQKGVYSHKYSAPTTLTNTSFQSGHVSFDPTTLIEIAV